MKVHTRALLLLTFLTAGILSACGLLREPEQPSGPIEATPVLIPTETETSPAYPAPTNLPESIGYPEPEINTGENTEVPTPGYPSPDNLRVYTISQAESRVRFELDEDLRGKRNTVVGVTDQVAGEIALDLTDLSTARVGVIQINARTLVTDNNLRNRAIQNQILDTGQYEFITFTPRIINGLPISVAIGEEVTFSIEGDLTIRNISQPVVFTIVARAVSADQLIGTASAVINRSDFNLSIPNVPNVANVEEEVELYIDFVANALN